MKIRWEPCRSGTREFAFLGENQVGFVRLDLHKSTRAVWTCTILPYPQNTTAHRVTSIPAAKAALEMFVKDWAAKSGLVAERIDA